MCRNQSGPQKPLTKQRRYLALGKGVIREEVWQDSRGNLVRYNLAFVNHFMCSVDKGRVLGYDSQHGRHHRHWMGRQVDFSFVSYEKLLKRFLAEVSRLRKREAVR